HAFTYTCRYFDRNYFLLHHAPVPFTGIASICNDFALSPTVGASTARHHLPKHGVLHSSYLATSTTSRACLQGGAIFCTIAITNFTGNVPFYFYFLLNTIGYFF